MNSDEKGREVMFIFSARIVTKTAIALLLLLLTATVESRADACDVIIDDIARTTRTPLQKRWPEALVFDLGEGAFISIQCPKVTIFVIGWAAGKKPTQKAFDLVGQIGRLIFKGDEKKISEEAAACYRDYLLRATGANEIRRVGDLEVDCGMITITVRVAM